MAQFIPFDANVEVNGQTILSFTSSVDTFTSMMLQVLEANGLTNIQPDHWYPQVKWMKAFKEISDKLGPNTLFAIGKAIPETADFPPEINELHAALVSIDIAYHMNHRKGDIGYYKVCEFNEHERVAYMECKNPYPSHFDRGIITTIVRKFKPEDSIIQSVELDETFPSRLHGDDSCTFKITW